MIVGILVLSLMASIAISKPAEESEPEQIAVFDSVWNTPRYPIGYEWPAGEGGGTPHGEGWGGDIITVYADVAVDDPAHTIVYIKYSYCHEMACVNGENRAPDDMDFCDPSLCLGWEMNYLGGTLYSYTLIGDWHNRDLPTYTASNYSGIHVEYTVYAKNHTAGEATFGGAADMYPYWPPTAVNVNAGVSQLTVHPGSKQQAFGNASYYNALNWHDQPPVDETPVTVRIDPGAFEYYGMTDTIGNFAVDFISPLTPGFYTVNTTVHNTTLNYNGDANRDAVCVSDEIVIEVVSPVVYDIDLTGANVDDWVFVSFPIDAYSDPAIVFGDAIWGDSGTDWDYIQWYDPNDPADHWKMYSISKPPALNDMPTVNNIMGFWLHLTNNKGDQMLTVASGDEPTGTIVHLEIGWNLVGYPSQTETYSVGDLKTDSSGMVTIVEGFDPGAPYLIQEMGDGDNFLRGDAYWIYSTAVFDWVIT
jgi:hypothetical protein